MEDKISNQETILYALRNMFGSSKTFEFELPFLKVIKIDNGEKHIWEYEVKFQLVEERLCKEDN